MNPYLNSQIYNPYLNQMSNKLDIVHVNGENGARAYQMPPNSNILLLDDTAPLVWLAQTDGAGYKTVIPYSITPYVPEPQPDMKSLEDRIKKLEEFINDKSNVIKTDATEPTVWQSSEHKADDKYY